ncbi:MAG TPA: glycosyltransferase, partial [Mycobacteriales bacterium]|nr:glycosyltransferase [Mycobacteriales bacterium]
MQLALVGAVFFVTVTLFVMSATTLWWMLHAWRTPDTLVSTGYAVLPDAPELSFSLLVPARHEQAVLATTLERLVRVQHPAVEILAIVGHDDPETEAVARSVASRHPAQVRVVIDHHVPKNKPKALMTALPECRGEIVGVFDAEDDVDHRLLRFVDAAFRRTGADVVQSGVQLVDIRAHWFSMRNCLEYFFWFRSRLHLQARRGFIPLGGNTVFVRADVLRAAGGWDTTCLAEDCELGVRLSVAGARTAVAYDPHIVTREETPPTMRALIKQRTRWNQGFLQVYRKGLWRGLPRRQRALARFTLAQPFLQ